MAEMKTITINGKTYTVDDPDSVSHGVEQNLTDEQKTRARKNIGAAADREVVKTVNGHTPDENGAVQIIDDTKAGTDAWSSKNIVDKLCPEFTESGGLISCEPVEGYPLAVVSEITPVQDGTPSPQAPCPITGYTAVTLTHNGQTQTMELGQTVYGGSVDWDTGVLTLTHKMLILTGNEAAGYWKVGGNDVYTTVLIRDHDKSSQVIRNAWCSHVSQKTDGAGLHVDSSYINHANAVIGGISFNRVVANWGYPEVSVDAHVAFLKAQYEAGTPVQILYKLGTPVTAQLEKQEILALSGENILYSDTGDTTVTGRMEPSVKFAKLEARIAALEAALVNT